MRVNKIFAQGFVDMSGGPWHHPLGVFAFRRLGHHCRFSSGHVNKTSANHWNQAVLHVNKINVTEFVDIVLRNAVSPIRIVFTYPHQLNRHVNKISETIGIKPFFMSTKVPRR